MYTAIDFFLWRDLLSFPWCWRIRCKEKIRARVRNEKHVRRNFFKRRIGKVLARVVVRPCICFVTRSMLGLRTLARIPCLSTTHIRSCKHQAVSCWNRRDAIYTFDSWHMSWVHPQYTFSSKHIRYCLQIRFPWNIYVACKYGFLILYIA